MDDIRFRSARPRPTSQRTPASTKSTTQRTTYSSGSRASTTPAPHRASPQKNATSVEEPFIPLERLRQDKKPKVKKSKKTTINRWLVVILIGTLICLAGYVVYSYVSSRNPALEAARDINNNSEELALAIKAEVAKSLEDLPDETPKLETVTDPAALGESFKDAQQGDKILYFESAGKAVIYRPSSGKVLVYTYYTDSRNSESQPSTEDPSTETTPEQQSESTGTETPAGESPLSDTPSPLLP